jgi:xanthine dehydrogenase accessory factor
MTIRELRNAFDSWRGERIPLILASVYETAGSTYSKAGARMLITGDGRFRGMLSGGCLEGDLAEHAKAVVESGAARTVTYDLGKNDEELWGLGVGCDGLMRIFLQPLLPQDDYQPFAAICDVLAGDATGVAVTVLEPADASPAPGATLVWVAGHTLSFGVVPEHREALLHEAQGALESGQSRSRELELGGRSVKILAARLVPPPRLLILGAGLDAEPVVRLATELGWRVTVQDHRQAYIDKGDFRSAERVLCLPAEALSEQVLDRPYDAVIVMSHHLATDRVYLAQLARTDIGYVGLLGPRDRRRRLMQDLGAEAGLLEHRLHGPAGFDIGADGPASIALSILAEVHDVLKGKDAAS